MASDPRMGVVDSNGRVHGIGNLFIAGSSVFPTGGNDMPTLTIVALAHRLADRLKLELAQDQSGLATTPEWSAV
jgi:choline dehydrogenase-like flavoprotein